MNRIGIVVTVMLALLLAGFMLNIEFFRYFGFHSNWTHLSLLLEWKKISPLLTPSVDPADLALAFLVVPASYAIACAALRLEPLLRLIWRPVGIAATAGVFVIGLAVSRIAPIDPLLDNLARNYLVALVEASADTQPLLGQASLSASEVSDLHPLAGQPIGEPLWHTFDRDFPLVKATDHQLCRLAINDAATCQVDGDGYPLAQDCHDGSSTIHPGARDTPGDGIDSDCSGLDTDPPNIIFVHWEGVRGVNIGRIGHGRASTPRFDALTTEGVLFSNAYANGTQTRWSLISIYCSTLPRLSHQWIFKYSPDLELLCFPDVLRHHGYETIYVHGAFISLADKLPRLSRWFERRYDRTNLPIRDMPMFNLGAVDRDVFNFAYQHLQERRDSRPFFMTIATLAVHYPFEMPTDEIAELDHSKPEHQLSNLIRYTDDALGDFLDRILNEPRFANTVVVVASDHGINWFSPRPEREQNILWEDLVWVPLALLGKGWNLPPGEVTEIRQLADIGPTILDRVGIEIPNPFIGHSLLRRYGERDSMAFFATPNGGDSAGIRLGRYKYFEHFGSATDRLFDLQTDPREEMNLADDPQFSQTTVALRARVLSRYRNNERLLTQNRIWNERFWIQNTR